MSKTIMINMIKITINELESQKASYDNSLQVGNRVMDILDNTITELTCLLSDEFGEEY